MAKFKTRARTVDMLGRQQIAGIPNAISELFKNAYDAYADKVEIDYFLSNGLFILRDDGLGMTKTEFEDRWLTLGTESKLQIGKKAALPPIDTGKKRRPILGEKGIGRLSIAVIGSQVLVLTRAKRGKEINDLVAAFVHWGLFECPGINLDQIEIPIQIFSGGALPTKKDIKKMTDFVKRNVKDLEKDIEKDTVKNIIDDLDMFELDPEKFAKHQNYLDLKGQSCGTHFYIMPASENLSADIEIDLEGKETSRLRKLLLGFCKTMTSDSVSPPIKTAFRYWSSDNEPPFDLIGEREFITPKEFNMADHHVKGEFNEWGQFKGTVTIYDQEQMHEIIPWPKSVGKEMSCGRFKINLAFIQGTQRESKLSREDYSKLHEKLNRVAGLYIYRDGIRILPYGDSKFDFLDIEERRTKSAGYYYFSYRNMIGAVDISRKFNPKLIEKAGREGFQENKAYREFRAILINFLIQIAADFFREGSAHADIYLKRKKELDRAERARREREKKSIEARRKFQAELEEFFTRANEGKFQEIIELMINNFEALLSKAIKSKSAKQYETKLIMGETQALKELNQLRKSCLIKKPRGFGLTKELKRDWEFYLVELDRLENEIFTQSEIRIDKLANDAIKKSKYIFDRYRRSVELLNEIVSAQREGLEREIKDTHAVIAETKKRIVNLTGEILAFTKNTISDIGDEFQSKNIKKLSQNNLHGLRQKYENRISKEVSHYTEILSYIRAQLQRIDWSRGEDGQIIGEAEMTAALEDELLAFREQSEADIELVQLGMAIDIINHEFNSSVKAIRNQLKRLKDWADVNPDLRNLYQNICADFDHLDGYLTLFTPLHRRLYRKAIKITGAAICTYINDLFRVRMQRHQINLIATSSFKKKAIIGYPSTFYPVFVNLIDNAIFWLKNRKHPRKIILDSRGEAFLVSNNGPAISVRDYEAIFEMGFSRKPGGRGLGLYISRQVLEREGYKLEVEKTDASYEGVKFKIYPNNIDDKA